MKKTLLTIALIFTSLFGFGQVYNPGGTVTDSISAFTGDVVKVTDTLVYPNQILQLETIAELEAYTGESTTIFVKDSLRGGIFNYVASGLTSDDGIVFDAADGGSWKRDFNPNDGVNVAWWGAIPDGITDLGQPTNAAIDFLGAEGGTVVIPAGDYLISNSIRIKSNITLDATNANLTLDDNANQYMLRTANDFQNELDIVSNITITGGIWNANRNTQTLNITDALSLDTDYYGWGIAIVNSENVKVYDLEIGNSLTWAIAHIHCDNILFDNIFINQPSGGANDDGIAGTGASNLVINNVRGYSKDNLIGIHTEVMGFLGHGVQPDNTYFPPHNIDNVTIKNITKYPYDPFVLSPSIINNAVTAGFSVNNLIIDGVKGSGQAEIINFGGYKIAEGGVIRNNILINNIQVISPTIGSTRATITIESEINNLTITNVSRKEVPLSPNNYNNLILITNGAVVNSLELSNVNWRIRHEAPASPPLSLIKISNGFIGSIQANNISFVDEIASPICFFWATDPISNKGTTRIEASNIYIPNTTRDNIILNGFYEASANSLSIDTDKEELTPENGDVIKENGVLYTYNGTNWVDLINEPETDPVFLASASSGLLLHEQTITSTELLNIGTTAVELIPAPGAGKIIVVERVVAKMEAQTSAYDFTNGLQMVYDTYDDAIAVFNNTFTNSILDAYSTIDGGSVPAHTNAGVYLESVSDPTQGDGILHLKIYYRIVEF